MLQGFKTLERTNLVVNANDKLAAGMLTLEVGAMTEEVSVSSRVTEVQSTSGERVVHARKRGAARTSPTTAACSSTSRRWSPARCSQNTGGAEIGSVSGFTVNGQRPNSNNITIDGVSNIDTGDNGGNMATTNIDAVAEFKILTNAYQAEYGRAVGGQMQVVTKSGTQQFRGSGYWYGRRSDWDANTWLNKRATPRDRQGQDVAQRLRLHDRRAGLLPRLQRGQEEAVLLLEPGISASQQSGEPASDARADRARAAG